MGKTPRVSERCYSMQESPIRKLTPLADKAKARGIKIYHLNVGQPDIETPGVMLDRALNLKERVIRYSPSPGEKALLDSLEKYYNVFCGISVNTSDIIVTSGGSEAIIFALMAASDPGGEVIVFEPFYTNYNGFATMAGLTLVPVSTHIEDGFRLPPMAEIEAKVTPRTRAILLCNPNNPTGMVYSRERIDSLRDIAIKHGLFILSDEVYREFTYDGQKHISILGYPELTDHAIMLDSFSKRYSYCGGRIGCMVSRNREVMVNSLKFAQARLSVSYVDQMMATAIDQLGDSYYRETVDEYLRRRDTVYEGLKKIDDVVCTKAPGAFYCMARLPITDSEDFARWLIEEFSHENETVMISPAPGFYTTSGRGMDEIRIAYVLNCDALKRAMHIFGIAVDTYRKRK